MAGKSHPAAARKAASEFGMKITELFGTGHGVGLAANEEPWFRPKGHEDEWQPEEQMILQPGMTAAIEPSVKKWIRGMIYLENTFVITEYGAELLTHTEYAWDYL